MLLSTGKQSNKQGQHGSCHQDHAIKDKIQAEVMLNGDNFGHSSEFNMILHGLLPLHIHYSIILVSACYATIW